MAVTSVLATFFIVVAIALNNPWLNLPTIKISADNNDKGGYLNTSVDDNTNTRVSNKFNQTQPKEIYSSSLQPDLNQKYTLQSNNSNNQSNNVIQSVGIFEDKTQSVINNYNRFKDIYFLQEEYDISIRKMLVHMYSKWKYEQFIKRIKSEFK